MTVDVDTTELALWAADVASGHEVRTALAYSRDTTWPHLGFTIGYTGEMPPPWYVVQFADAYYVPFGGTNWIEAVAHKRQDRQVKSCIRHYWHRVPAETVLLVVRHHKWSPGVAEPAQEETWRLVVYGGRGTSPNIKRAERAKSQYGRCHQLIALGVEPGFAARITQETRYPQETVFGYFVARNMLLEGDSVTNALQRLNMGGWTPRDLATAIWGPDAPLCESAAYLSVRVNVARQFLQYPRLWPAAFYCEQATQKRSTASWLDPSTAEALQSQFPCS